MIKVIFNVYDSNYAVAKIANYENGGWRNWRVREAFKWRGESFLVDAYKHLPKINNTQFVIKEEEVEGGEKIYNKNYKYVFVVSEGGKLLRGDKNHAIEAEEFRPLGWIKGRERDYE